MRRGTVASPLAKIPRAMLKALPSFLLQPNPELYLSDNFVVVDLETNTKGDDGSPMPCWPVNSIVCGSWCHGLRGEAHNIYGNELEIGELVQAVEDADFVVAHSGKFDIGWLKRAGIDMYKVLLYDTMIAEYCLNGNLKAELSLDALSTKYLGKSKAPYINICMKGGVDPGDMPKSKLIARCNWDITQTRELFLQQLDKVCDRGLLGHVYTRCILSPALADIEAKGMHIDSERVNERYRESAAKLAASAQAIDEFTGGINPRSPKQVKEFVYEVLKFKPKRRGRGRHSKPIYSTKSDDLLALKATTKRQREFVKLKKEYAGHNADVGKNLLFFHGVATDKRKDIAPGIFYAQFNQCVTVTHRLSSSGIKRTFSHLKDDKGKEITKSVQFQNFGRKFKPLFCPCKKGWSMGEADGAQVEFRVAAFLGQCQVATQAIVDNLDVHADTASQLHSMDLDEFKRKHAAHDPEVEGWRQDAKPDTFKPLYGGKSGTKGQMAYYKWFKEHYRGIGETQQAWLDEALTSKKVKMIHGFTFFFPDCKLQGSGYITNSTNICNYPVQHFATAEIIPIAVAYMWHAMKTMESFLVNTIHDSVIAELHPDEHEQFKEYSLHAFTTLMYYYLKEVYGVEFNVPLGIGVKIGEHWGEGHEVKCVPMAPYLMDGIDYKELITEWVND
jgi:DNA polymerase I-like protein with 3'-5' exonuclease and polymerase domains